MGKDTGEGMYHGRLEYKYSHSHTYFKKHLDRGTVLQRVNQVFALSYASLMPASRVCPALLQLVI